ncbi:MAG: FGGY family carbohydrate kinase [Bacteroidota bacterium]|nr:FGGY family carbohydrate kinase [Bacteroidota bacterium]
MRKQNVIAIFDVGKTNKKLFLFDQNYKIVFERSARFFETVDEDGDACENLDTLGLSVFDSLREVFRLKDLEIKAINFCSYGASLVFLNEERRAFAPLYNYLKKYPESLKKQFYDTYGGEEEFSFRTASPVLGSLNSGMQLFRIKYEKPDLFNEIKYALHLPQYLSFLISANLCSDITSIGCHTNLWDFQKNEYHYWVKQEGVFDKLPPILPCNKVVPASFPGNKYSVGIGLHDSSAALIPYLVNFQEPFILISTGTWCISLNPFNHSPLTKEELENDCLCYMTYEGKPVKASRLFAGYEHEQQVKRIGEHFTQNAARYRVMDFNAEIISMLQKRNIHENFQGKNPLKDFLFAQRNMDEFINDEEAYHQLMLDIVSQQFTSTQLVLKGTNAKRIFVDGGFSKNSIYMNLLASRFPEIEVFAASMAQATAVGAALAIHDAWNQKPLPNDIIELKYFSVNHYSA